MKKFEQRIAKAKQHRCPTQHLVKIRQGLQQRLQGEEWDTLVQNLDLNKYNKRLK